MNIVDIFAIIILVLGALIGFKKGAIKGLIHLIGLVAIVIIAYQFKNWLGDLFIRKLPFFNFGGAFEGIYSINILVYEGVAFIVIFVLLYCILNILINISGILDILVKLTIILEIPSKIVGTIIGLIESIIFIFIVSFVLLQVGPTQKYIMDSKIALKIAERTPVVNDVFRQTIVASEDIYNSITNHKDAEDKTEANLEIIRSLIRYNIVDAPTIQELIDDGKLHMNNVVVAS